jgi:hypothetical protein
MPDAQALVTAVAGSTAASLTGRAWPENENVF